MKPEKQCSFCLKLLFNIDLFDFKTSSVLVCPVKTVQLYKGVKNRDKLIKRDLSSFLKICSLFEIINNYTVFSFTNQ